MTQTRFTQKKLFTVVRPLFVYCWVCLPMTNNSSVQFAKFHMPNVRYLVPFDECISIGPTPLHSQNYCNTDHRPTSPKVAFEITTVELKSKWEMTLVLNFTLLILFLFSSKYFCISRARVEL